MQKTTRRGLLAITGLSLTLPSVLSARTPVQACAQGRAELAFALPPQPTIAEYTVDVGGLALWCRDSGGAGEPLVLLHPATGSAEVWSYQFPAFVAQGYRVIAYSRRGHFGSTSGPPDDVGTGADDLKALIDRLRLDRIHLLGTAAGGFIAPDFAVSWPDRLLTLTLACTLGGGTDAAYRAAHGALLPPQFSSLPATFRELGPHYRAACPQGVTAWEEREHRAVASGRIRQRPRNTLDWSTLGTIRVPTLSIAGGADLYAPPPVMAEYASHIPGCQIATIADAGHAAHWERPDEFNALVQAHLARHSARG